jgi:hypothetical protein
VGAAVAAGLLTMSALAPSSPARAGATRATDSERGVACRSVANAIDIRAVGMSCSQASSAIQTYETSPLGCVNARHCVQSGIDHTRQAIIDDCRRRGLGVTCVVYIETPSGPVVDPRIAGGVIPGHFDRATVTFRMRHDVARRSRA